MAFAADGLRDCLQVGKAQIKIGTCIKYFGLGPKWRFGEHFAWLAPRVRKVTNALKRLLPNLRGLKKSPLSVR